MDAQHQTSLLWGSVMWAPGCRVADAGDAAGIVWEGMSALASGMFCVQYEAIVKKFQELDDDCTGELDRCACAS